MEPEADETGAAASLLALHTMAVWLVQREAEREPGARLDLMRHTEIALALVVRRDPGLLAAAQSAAGTISRAMGEVLTTPRLQ